MAGVQPPHVVFQTVVHELNDVLGVDGGGQGHERRAAVVADEYDCRHVSDAEVDALQLGAHGAAIDGNATCLVFNVRGSMFGCWG